MFKFITGKPLWVNILFSMVIVAVLLSLFLLSLNFLTHHGRTLNIPSVTGRSYEEAKKILESQGFDVEIQDSVYNDTAAALSVLRQFPAADEVVKVNRTVYLTISRSVPPTIEMPQLEGLSYRQVEIVLKQYSLKLGDTSYRNDLARNAVLEQLFNGQRIKPGTKISMGSTIDLILGSGLGQDEFGVPDLIGYTFAEAKILIETNGLIMGLPMIDSDVTDTAGAFVYQQRPERFTLDGRVNRIRQGQTVDLFLSKEKPEHTPIVDTTKNQDY